MAGGARQRRSSCVQPKSGGGAEASAAAVGEIWKQKHEPEELAAVLRAAGFSRVEMLTPELAAPYFAHCSGGENGLRPPPRVSIGVAMV